MTEEEIARLRSYLATQSMRRTPQEIVEALQEAYHQFTTAVAAFPHAAYHTHPDDQTWSVFEIVEHVCLFLSGYQAAICGVLENGQRPPDVNDRQEILPRGRKTDTREKQLSAIEEVFQQLTRSVRGADPSLRLDMTWKHFELGDMHWREWLLFNRVHLLDHIGQVKQLQERVVSTLNFLPDELLARLVTELDEDTVTAIILHGSYARGDAIPPYSDIDLVRIILETSPLPRKKRYIWRDGYLISFSSRPLSLYREWFAAPEEAIFRVSGVQEARILMEKDTSFRAFQQEALAFHWEPLQEKANTYASQLLLEQTEMVLHLQRAQALRDRIALMDMTLELFSASTEAIAVQRGVLVKSGNTYYHQVQLSVGRDTTWTRYHNQAAGIDLTTVPSLEKRSMAALALYRETIQLLQPSIMPEHWQAIEPLLTILHQMLRKEIL